MKLGTYSHKSASLRITESTLVAEHLRQKLREVSAVYSDEPGKGHAGELMRQVLAVADDHGMTLMLCPEPFADAPMGAEELKAWYGRLGFTQIQADPCVMARPPKRKLNA